MPTTEIHLTFPDERARSDFETAFKGWMVQWQTQQLILRRLILSTASPDDINDAEPAGLAESEHHVIGVNTGEDGLFGTGEIDIVIDGQSVHIGGMYINLIGGF